MPPGNANLPIGGLRDAHCGGEIGVFGYQRLLQSARRQKVFCWRNSQGTVVAKRLVIGICGGTDSGKTTITERIISALSPERVLVLQQGHYYKDFPHLPLE
jgi:hypothetical protein